MRRKRYSHAPLESFLLSAYIALTVYIYARSFLELPRQVWTFFVLPLLALGFVLAHSLKRGGGRRTALLFGLTIAITLFMESLGVTTGWVFGRYYYYLRVGGRGWRLDTTWEQEKLEARKMLVNRARAKRSPTRQV